MGCERCEGTGFVTVYDSVDYGSAQVSMPTGIGCPACLEKGLCPKCLSPLDCIETLEKQLEQLERVRFAAQFYVNSPMKFGIRHSAYRKLVKALDESKS